MAVTTDKPTLDQVIDYLTHRLEGMTMPGAVRMTTAARDYLVELRDKLTGNGTNADRIRAMSDEELAREFGRQCPKGNTQPCDSCSHCWLYWLQQPAEEGA